MFHFAEGRKPRLPLDNLHRGREKEKRLPSRTSSSVSAGGESESATIPATELPSAALTVE